jgi:hypothetical protein
MISPKRVLVIDTSLLCVWLKVPGMETCGVTGDAWDFARVDKEIQGAIRDHFTLVLPLATIIETGNHIAHAARQRHQAAVSLAERMRDAADAKTPWAAFQHQSDLWGPDQLRDLARTWPPLADSKFSLGDATIQRVGEYYAQSGCEVRFLTADRQLQAYEPPPPPLIPRRRQPRQ